MYSLAIDMTKQPVMCTFIEPKAFYDKENPELHPECIPCEVMLFHFITVSNNSKITANESKA